MRSRFKGSKRVTAKRKMNKTMLLKTFLFLLLVTLLVFLFINVTEKIQTNKRFEDDALEFANLNTSTLFSIDKVTLFSSANGVQDSEVKQGFVLDIYQYTDIALQITNSENLKIQEFYIDNISYFTKPELGNPILRYKNPLDFGKTDNEKDPYLKETEDIFFKVLDTNIETDYTKAHIYNNLSNPVTLTYINKGVKTGYSVSARELTLTYDGNLLQKSNVDLNKLECKLSFDVHILVTDLEEYVCKISIDIPLKNGTSSIYERKPVRRIRYYWII